MPNESDIVLIKRCIRTLEYADCSDKEEMHGVVDEVCGDLRELQAELQIEIDEKKVVVPLVAPGWTCKACATTFDTEEELEEHIAFWKYGSVREDRDEDGLVIEEGTDPLA
jgi:hypothetical protein